MPVEMGPRNYVGPEQPKAPPMPVAMPPAEELLDQSPGVGAQAVGWDSPEAQAAFRSWSQENMPEATPHEVAVTSAAFFAGWQARAVINQTQGVRAPELPLEGTVESRTIIAALELFKSQVLVENPPEVKSGEWLNARDVDVLIQGIRRSATERR